MKFEIKKSHKMPAREGYHWSAEIWVNGQKGLFIEDEGRGGEINIRWFSEEIKNQIIEYVKNLPKQTDVDLFLAGIVDDSENNKIWQRKCKTGTYFLMKGDKEEDGWRVAKNKAGKKMPFTPELKQAMQKAYGDKLGEILNERFQ